MSGIKDDEVVQTLSADRADEPLGVWILSEALVLTDFEDGRAILVSCSKNVPKTRTEAIQWVLLRAKAGPQNWCKAMRMQDSFEPSD